MPQNIITEKIRDLSPGQILSYYGFYLLQKESSYCFYKNDEHLPIFVYSALNGELSFMETLDFKVLDKITLFYYLAERLGQVNILQSIKDILAVTEYDTYYFTESISEKNIMIAYYALDKSDILQGTPLEDFAFRRYGDDALVFKDHKNHTVDVVTYKENVEEVFSEFGNNMGIHYISNPDANTAMMTYHPNNLKTADWSKYSFIVTKYSISLVEVLSLLKKESIENIFIPLAGQYSHLYKLQTLIKFYNFYSDSGIKYDLQVSANNFHCELFFNLRGGPMDKLELVNHFSQYQNTLKKVFSDHTEEVLMNLLTIYNFRTDIYTEGTNHCGKLTFRNNISLLEIIINDFEESVNAIGYNRYKFV